MTNAASGNAVLVFDRGADGTISPGGSFATGGLGTGAGLGSQDALVLSGNGKWLYAVNAGSNEISAFAASKDGLALVSKIGSGGTRPISLTVAHDLMYVLNAGDGTIAGNIAGAQSTRTPSGRTAARAVPTCRPRPERRPSALTSTGAGT